MAKGRRKPVPKSQTELSQNTITPYDNVRGKSLTPEDTKKNRGHQRSLKGDDVKQFHIGLKDIDQAIFYYFDNVIRPDVVQNGRRVPVPAIYGSPERWAAVQKDGFYRDKNGKIQVPLIMVKRTNIEKNRSMGNKMDANNPTQFGIFQKRYSRKNIYDKFSLLTNREPVEELYGVIVPDYVNITYECVIFTEYTEQMNRLIEAINFASDAYWGDKDRFNFRAMIDSYTTTTELAKGQDRTVKTSFSIKLLGHVVPDTINTSVANMNKFYSKAAINFGMEAVDSISKLDKVSSPRTISKGPRFFDQVYNSGGLIRAGETLTDEMKEYLLLTTVLDTNERPHLIDTANRKVRFNGVTMATPPSGFPALTKEDFLVFINGVSVEISAIDSISAISGNIEIQFNATLGHELLTDMEVVSIGKYIA